MRNIMRAMSTHFRCGPHSPAVSLCVTTLVQFLLLCCKFRVSTILTTHLQHHSWFPNMSGVLADIVWCLVEVAWCLAQNAGTRDDGEKVLVIFQGTLISSDIAWGLEELFQQGRLFRSAGLALYIACWISRLRLCKSLIVCSISICNWSK